MCAFLPTLPFTMLVFLLRVFSSDWHVIKETEPASLTFLRVVTGWTDYSYSISTLQYTTICDIYVRFRFGFSASGEKSYSLEFIFCTINPV